MRNTRFVTLLVERRSSTTRLISVDTDRRWQSFHFRIQTEQQRDETTNEKRIDVMKIITRIRFAGDRSSEYASRLINNVIIINNSSNLGNFERSPASVQTYNHCLCARADVIVR